MPFSRLPSVGRCYAVIHDGAHATTEGGHCIRAGASRGTPAEGTLAGGPRRPCRVRPHLSITAGTRAAHTYADRPLSAGRCIESQRGLAGDKDVGRVESGLTTQDLISDIGNLARPGRPCALAALGTWTPRAPGADDARGTG